MEKDKTGNEQNVPEPKYKIGDTIVSLVWEIPLQLIVRKAWGEKNEWHYLCWQSIDNNPAREPIVIPESEILYKL